MRRKSLELRKKLENIGKRIDRTVIGKKKNRPPTQRE